MDPRGSGLAGGLRLKALTSFQGFCGAAASIEHGQVVMGTHNLISIMSSPICCIKRDSATKEPVSYSFDASKLTVTEARKLNKGKFSNVRYDGGALYMETPELHAPISVSSFEDEGKKSLFVSCRGHEEREDVRMFVEALNSVQDKIIDQVASLKLLGDKVTRDMTAGLMSPLIKVSDTYPPAFRVNLPYRDGKAGFDAFTKTGRKIEPLDLDEVDVRGAKVKVIFTLTSVWVVNKNWGVTAKATQVLIKPAFSAPAAGVSCFTDEVMGDSDEDGDGVADRAESEDGGM